MSDILMFAGYEFAKNKACIVCNHVLTEERSVKIAVHDSDGWLEFLCGDVHSPEQSKVVGLAHVIDRLPQSESLPILRPGQFAVEDDHEN